MNQGDKVLCVAAVPKNARKLMKPTPKVGWVYLVEKAMILKDPNGIPSSAIKIAGIENLKGIDGQPVYLSSDYFVPLHTLAAANQLRKPKHP